MTDVKFNLTAHKALWNWLAEHPAKDQRDWPGFDTIDVCYLCFGCEYVYRKVKAGYAGGITCKNCPIKWGKGKDCNNKESLYDKWADASKNSHRTRKRVALQIANLPVKKEVECI